jgi:hypothetical protein
MALCPTSKIFCRELIADRNENADRIHSRFGTVPEKIVVNDGLSAIG